MLRLNSWCQLAMLSVKWLDDVCRVCKCVPNGFEVVLRVFHSFDTFTTRRVKNRIGNYRYHFGRCTKVILMELFVYVATNCNIWKACVVIATNFSDNSGNKTHTCHRRC